VPYVEYDEVEAICPDCGRIFRSEEALAAHREESHSGLEGSSGGSTPATVCPACQRKFASETELRAHAHDVHAAA
jgi:hypothetical protein